MKNTDVRPPVLILALALLIALSGCARGPANSNSNLIANVNVNVNANASTGANINASTAPSVIAAREPDTYRATLVFAAETEGGDKAIGIPALCRSRKSGNDRRLSLNYLMDRIWFTSKRPACNTESRRTKAVCRVDT